jgi:endonuclease YncB( thermonuclease family)
VLEEISYSPAIQDAKPLVNPSIFKFRMDKLYKVVGVLDKETLKLDTGLSVKLLGINILPQQESEAIKYLNKYIKGKQVFLKFDSSKKTVDNRTYAYAYLKNKIFVNKEMLKLGFAKPAGYLFSFKKKFEEVVKDN